MKRNYYFLIVLALLACISIVTLCSYREQPLNSLLPNEEMRECTIYGYYDGMESVVVGTIPQESIVSLLELTTVRKGKSSEAMPSRCFEIRVLYDIEQYLIVIGADKTISVATIGQLDSRTFWVDTSGELFEHLYCIHLENGGAEIP